MATLCLALALGGCASALSGGDKAVPTFDLTAPNDFSVPNSGRGQLVIAMPTALQVLDTERIVVEPASGQITYLNKAQWGDRLPALFQARLIESFENGSRARAVARADSAITADYLLLTDIRTFGIQTFGGGPEAVVEVSAKIVGNNSGRIAAAQVFRARVAAGGTDGVQATQALDQASDEVFVAIVRWAASR
ncbi:ABC-type transport auxiliary lipoprotein family protein [Ancylobacter pratisalsi]|uniref:ABC-type transport auxiliary lipoprotein family protein n=1 Tax=Ancylobacter pratisalsi TaxID=1745854 RepID=UPI001FE6906C|nr:ABC-type transport auxiliary lipoprotein family protein [Ancylobacter pratisalsi]